MFILDCLFFVLRSCRDMPPRPRSSCSIHLSASTIGHQLVQWFHRLVFRATTANPDVNVLAKYAFLERRWTTWCIWSGTSVSTVGSTSPVTGEAGKVFLYVNGDRIQVFPVQLVPITSASQRPCCTEGEKAELHLGGGGMAVSSPRLPRMRCPCVWMKCASHCIIP